MNPLISVYIPTKNRPDYLDRALRSIHGQTYSNIEVLVCDDGSDTSLKEVYDKYKNKFAALKWFRNENSIGAPSSRNLLIENASGLYITGLDDDDEFLPDRIEKFIYFTDLEKYSFIASPFLIDNGRRLTSSVAESGIITLEKLLFKNIVGNQIFTRTSRLRSIGGFDIEMPAWQDYDTWVRFIEEHGPGYKINYPTYKYNIGHELGRISNSQKAHEGYLRFINKHSDILSDKHRRVLFFRDIINRNAPIDLKRIHVNLDKYTLPLFMKFLIKKFYI